MGNTEPRSLPTAGTGVLLRFYQPKCPHREGAKRFDFGRHREEPEISLGQLIQIGQMFHHRDLTSKQDGMHRTHQIRGAVDVQRIDAD